MMVWLIQKFYNDEFTRRKAVGAERIVITFILF